MDNYKLFNENAKYDSIEFDIVKSIIDELNSKNIEISSLTVKNKLREESYYISQNQVSTFLRNNYKNLNLSVKGYSIIKPIYRIYCVNDNENNLNTNKCYTCKYTHICKYNSTNNISKTFTEDVIAETPGKAKYKFKKILLSKYPSLDIQYIDINAKLKK